MSPATSSRLSIAELLQLQRWNTPTIYNGWEQITQHNAARDLNEMNRVGFKALARRLCVGHAASCPIRWGCDVEVFGRNIQPGQLLHADQHGFLAVPFGEEERLLEAARFMDANESSTLIAAAQSAAGQTPEQILENFNAAAAQFTANASQHFGKKGEG